MNIDDLKRTPFKVEKQKVDTEILQARRDLAARAISKLNYSPLHNSVSTFYGKGTAEAAAAAAFERIGFEPLDAALVEKYKTSVKDNLNKKYWFRNFCFRNTAETIMWVAGIVGVLSAIATAAVMVESYNSHWNHHPWGWTVIPIVGLFTWWFTWWGIAFLRGVAYDYTSIYYDWSPQTIQYYHKPIPEFALAHAVALKEQLPTASFSVQELTSIHTTHKPDPDPFLVMQVGDIGFYIDVWEEPSFEARKVV